MCQVESFSSTSTFLPRSQVRVFSFLEIGQKWLLVLFDALHLQFPVWEAGIYLIVDFWEKEASSFQNDLCLQLQVLPLNIWKLFRASVGRAPKSLQMVTAAMKFLILILILIFQCLLLGRKVMTNLDSILKSRDITLPAKVHLIKSMVFPVVMYGCESWTVKKAERWKIDAFELWYRRRVLRVPWTARRSNQSVLKEISPECSLKGLMLKPKLQYFGYLMRRADSFEKTLMLEKIEGGRRRGQWRMRCLDGITD